MLFLFADKDETAMPTTSMKELHLNDALFMVRNTHVITVYYKKTKMLYIIQRY